MKIIQTVLIILRNILKKIDWLKDDSFKSVIGVGGSFRNLGKIDRRRKRYPIDIVHNYVLYDYDIDEMFHLLKSKNLRQRQKLKDFLHLELMS